MFFLNNLPEVRKEILFHTTLCNEDILIDSDMNNILLPQHPSKLI